MPRFVRTLDLSVDPASAFAWHARPGAFQRLAPPWQEIRIAGRAPELVDGSRLTFHIHQGPFRLRWVAEHRDVEPGERFSDVQVEGPFAAWHHRHSFFPRDGGSTLEDRIDWSLPAGRLTDTVARRFLEADLDRMFVYRHATLREDLALHARLPSRPLRVAVSGTHGLIGSTLVAFLGTAGHQVVRLVRGGERPHPDEVRWSPGDGVDSRDLARLEGLDAVVHLAGEGIADRRWSEQRKHLIRHSRTDGTERLVTSLAALEQPPDSFLCASAVGFYGDRGDQSLDESSPPGGGFLADVCRAWEQRAEQARSFARRVVRLRFGVVLSPRGGALARMLPPFRLGLGGPLGSGHQQLPWISIDDTAGAILHAIASPTLDGAVNVTAPRPLPQRDLARILGRVLRRPAVAPLPAPVARALFGELADEALLASTAAEPRALLADGFVFRHPDPTTALAHLLGRAKPAPEVR